MSGLERKRAARRRPANRQLRDSGAGRGPWEWFLGPPASKIEG